MSDLARKIRIRSLFKLVLPERLIRQAFHTPPRYLHYVLDFEQHNSKVVYFWDMKDGKEIWTCKIYPNGIKVKKHIRSYGLKPPKQVKMAPDAIELQSREFSKVVYFGQLENSKKTIVLDMARELFVNYIIPKHKKIQALYSDQRKKEKLYQKLKAQKRVKRQEKDTLYMKVSEGVKNILKGLSF